jgi:long-chain acyl-CoA synthetase
MRDHLATLLDDFRRYGRQIAVVRFHGNRRRATSYGEIARLAGRFAALLAQQGVVPGDRVLLWGENSAEWIAAFYGCMLRGVLAVPLDAYGTAEFARRVAADVRPRLVVGDALLMRQLGPVPSHFGDKDKSVARVEPPERVGHAQEPVDGGPNEWPGLAFSGLAFEDWLRVLPTEEAGPVEGLARETPLEILFTSGTTGEPKGIVLTHGNILASVEPIERGAQPYLRYERLVHPLRFLHTLPLSHVFGQTMGLWVPPIFAAEVHFESRLVASRLIETIRKERISVLAAVPRVMALLKTHLEISRPGLTERIAASQGIRAWKRWWRFRDLHAAFGFKFWALISGGGALAGPLEQFWNALGFVVVQGYGMTETSALITLNHPFHVARGSIGKPLPGREVKLGEDGEVLVRGETISGATWSGGALRPRESEWLTTGDLAEKQPGGELRFVGRKSEVIVTAAGVNLHPEDLEAAIEQEPAVAACAVVAMETASGPEPCAVVAMRGSRDQAAAAIEQANRRLAEFQRLRRWVLWPEPDLPRTSTGKVRRKAVAEWLAGVQAAANATANGKSSAAVPGAFAASADWLLALIAEITGETPTSAGDELRLSEDLQLDSLGRVQLAAALEERLGIAPESGLLEEVRTLGELRKLVAGATAGAQAARNPADPSEGQKAAPLRQSPDGLSIFSPAGENLPPGNPHPPVLAQNDQSFTQNGHKAARPCPVAGQTAETKPAEPVRISEVEPESSAAPEEYIYPHWPWLRPVQWVRAGFIEAVMRPLVWLLAHPRVVAPYTPAPNSQLSDEPMLIVANHVTAYDGPLVEYALPGPVRRRIAVAMAGEMIEDFRHFRNPERRGERKGFYLPGPLIYLLLTALFNVFPLPRKRNFQRSFAHAGEAMDRGYNVMVFPEGARSAEGSLARFRGGIGLLARQSGAPVLPVAIRGLGELKAGGGRWFRSGKIEVHVGQPIRFAPEETEATITARLHAEVEKLLNG